MLFSTPTNQNHRAQRDLSNGVLFSLIGQKLSEIQGLEEREAREGVQKDRGGRRTCRATKGHCKGPEHRIVVKEADEKGQSGKRGLGIEPKTTASTDRSVTTSTSVVANGTSHCIHNVVTKNRKKDNSTNKPRIDPKIWEATEPATKNLSLKFGGQKRQRERATRGERLVAREGKIKVTSATENTTPLLEYLEVGKDKWASHFGGLGIGSRVKERNLFKDPQRYQKKVKK